MRRAALAILVVVAAARLAPAELLGYRDADGTFHVVSDPRDIPPQFRDAATRGARVGSGTTRPPQQPAEPPALETGADAPTATAVAPETVLRSVDTASDHIVLDVVLNGSVSQRMLVDTGASMTVLPIAAAERLGLSLRPPYSFAVVQTASGEDIVVAVRLKSLQIGDLRVEDVPVLLSRNLPGFGLLGADFLSNYQYSVDPLAHTLTLAPFDASERSGTHGGRPASWWKGRYADVRGRIGGLKKLRAAVAAESGRQGRKGDDAPTVEGPLGPMSTRDFLGMVDMSVRFWELELASLDRAADAASVPYDLR